MSSFTASGAPVEVKYQYTDRSIPRISLKNHKQRREEIKEQLYEAAITDGFFSLYGQDFPSKSDIEKVFKLSQQFFDLPMEAKMKTPHQKLKNTGYEYLSQVRPSSGLPDQKESIQMQLHRLNENWPAVDDVGQEWRETYQEFVHKINELSIFILELFAEKLNYPLDFFSKSHDISKATAQSTLRLIHYFDSSNIRSEPNTWRAAPHTDFDSMTMLFCRDGDHGLEICPGREAHTDYGFGDQWTPVPSVTGEIVVNIGDMLMSWSDDKLKSNFHRVRMPLPGESHGDRYTIVWFNQANTDVIIQGPEEKYPPLTGKEFIENAMKRNFERLQLKQAQLAAN